MHLPKVLLADDHPLTTEGLKSSLAPYFETVGVVSDGMALIENAERLKPDLIILDITMPLLNGIDAARRIRQTLPGTKLLFVTMHTDPSYLEAALKAGADGYMLKSAPPEEIVKAANRVLAGQTHIAAELSLTRLESCATAKNAASKLRLSPRERQTLQLIAEGRASKEIAFVMSISTKTVAYHRENLKTKLGLRTTAELTRHAVQEGLV